MAYNQGGYGQQSQQGYGQQNPYGQSGNPYGQNTYGGNPYQQEEQPYGHTGNYSERPDLHQQTSSRYDEESGHGSSYEMNNMNSRDPNRILNEIQNINAAIDHSENKMQELQMLQKSWLGATDTSNKNPLRAQVFGAGDKLVVEFQGLVQRVRRLKASPETYTPRNEAQFGKLERRLKAAMNQYQQLDRDFRHASNDNLKRAYRTDRPDASDAEIQEAIESGGDQIFSQALVSSNRRGDAQTTARTVKNRHEEIQKIEKQMAELAQLFIDLESQVVQQEASVAKIESGGMEVQDHVVQANTELDGAVVKARSARKKKWMCLGIALLIIIIIVVVVVVAVLVTRGKQ